MTLGNLRGLVRGLGWRMTKKWLDIAILDVDRVVYRYLEPRYLILPFAELVNRDEPYHGEEKIEEYRMDHDASQFYANQP